MQIPPDGFGEIPSPGLLFGDTALFGTAPGGGTGTGAVFKVDPNTGVQTVLHEMDESRDGGFPQSGVIGQDGTLYGANQVGGAGDGGTIFKVDPDTGAYAVLYGFALHKGDGGGPNGVLYVGGTLYGTTTSGGAHSGGLLFGIDSRTGAETRLHEFGEGADGLLPSGSLVYHDGVLFGTTAVGGGSANAGTVFRFDPKTRNETILYRFAGKADGAEPYAGLTYMDGVLYGVAFAGGTFNGVCKVNVDAGCGTVFAIDPASGKETTLHRFSGRADGAGPYASLAAHAGALYGSTMAGGRAAGRDGQGTLFRLTP